MMNQNDQPSTSELKRRALRWQRHRLPRKSRMPPAQRLTAWLMLMLTIALALVLATK